MPNLLQYVSSGAYFARVKVKGKIIRRSLRSTVWSTARVRLLDFLSGKRPDDDGLVQAPVFSEAVAAFKAQLGRNPAMKESSRHYRLICLRKIELSWPELWTLRLDKISSDACMKWADRLRMEIASQYFNNVVGTLRMVFETGIEIHGQQGGKGLQNPAVHLTKARIKQKELRLPESAQFKRLVREINASGSWGQKSGDLVEFLAYSGLRLYTEAKHLTWDDVDWERREIIVRGDPETRTKNWEVRRVPIIGNMDELLNRMMKRLGGAPKGKLLALDECPITLRNACAKIGVSKLTHHDLRHLFATRCIESGVDIPTVARWLGHKDGGALAMKVYGHLRNEHSQAMAQKVVF